MNIHEDGVSSRSVRYFWTPSSFAERIFYYPTRIGHYYCDRRYHFTCQCDTALQTSHRLNYMLMLVKHGRFDLTIEGRHFSAERNHLVLFDCKQPHEYSAATDDLEFYWLLFNGAQTPALYQEILNLHNTGHIFSLTDPAPIQLGMTKLLTYGEMSQRAPEHTSSDTIYSMLCHLLSSGAPAGSDLDAIITRSLAYMDQHFDAPLSVEDVAGHISLSSSYFTKQFRACTGYSPYEYLTLRRIDRAKELLLTSGMTVKQVAFETGYNSEENFIRAFKKKVGLSPSSFRQYPI